MGKFTWCLALLLVSIGGALVEASNGAPPAGLPDDLPEPVCTLTVTAPGRATTAAGQLLRPIPKGATTPAAPPAPSPKSNDIYSAIVVLLVFIVFVAIVCFYACVRGEPRPVRRPYLPENARRRLVGPISGGPSSSDDDDDDLFFANNNGDALEGILSNQGLPSANPVVKFRGA